jgi:hypothetical protein
VNGRKIRAKIIRGEKWIVGMRVRTNDKYTGGGGKKGRVVGFSSKYPWCVWVQFEGERGRHCISVEFLEKRW